MMAENKKAFMLYADLIHTVKKMKPAKAGELFVHILEYVNDENPVTDDILIQIAFEPIKQQLKRDLKKYETTCEKNRKIAEERWAKVPKSTKSTTGISGIPKSTKSTDTDNDTDNDTDIYLNIERFSDFRNLEFENIDDKLKDKLKSFGVTKPMIRNTNSTPRQYVDVVEVLVYIFKAKEWSSTMMMNLNLTEERFKLFMRDFIKEYVSNPALNYDESKFQGHFFNWVKIKLN